MSDVLSESKRQPGFLSSLREMRVLQSQISNSHHILRDEALHGAAPVLDGEGGAVRFERRGLGGVILRM